MVGPPERGVLIGHPGKVFSEVLGHNHHAGLAHPPAPWNPAGSPDHDTPDKTLPDNDTPDSRVRFEVAVFSRDAATRAERSHPVGIDRGASPTGRAAMR